ncbi:efflux RND transporter periplasmic adaptor subunit [Marinobacterium weihaiense]|uniref:Efflux RND transporter periplasmic adaptor subunit n=1 Tax=Marinobacterium weihaiense TaxID=2851016 RepID=A0ABS6MG46_9GAMM|nr:efflux RND transporter periplasmic adaptor subunit [Marinobacterium weihaiense]MBV0934682.1 efflux RND transporter periplasmic adaptor subunit [Marinobacterium weihaiense]
MKHWLTGLSVVVLAALLLLGWQYLTPPSGDAQTRAPRVQSVHVVMPEHQAVEDRIRAVGTLRAREAITVSSEVSGRVVTLAFRTGQEVSRGDLLVQLDDRQARADLQVAEARLDDARRQLRRAQQLRGSNSIAQSRVDELRTAVDVAVAERNAAAVRLDNHRIEAPFAGVVGLRELSAGAYVESGDTLTTLDAVDPMELRFAIPERYLGQLKPGLSLQADSAAWPDRSFIGTLSELDTRVDPLSRSLKVKALIDNPQRLLRSGQFMSVQLVLRAREALVVPEQAVLLRGDEQYLFVVGDEGKAQRRRVALGARKPGWVEIRSGLTADEQVIVTAQDRLSSGDALRILEGRDNAIPPNRLTGTEAG